MQAWHFFDPRMEWPSVALNLARVVKMSRVEQRFSVPDGDLTSMNASNRRASRLGRVAAGNKVICIALAEAHSA